MTPIMPVPVPHAATAAQPAWFSTPLIAALPVAAKKELARGGVTRRLAKGAPLYTELQPPTHLWIVLSGRLRLLRHSSSGRVFALSLVLPGGVFCVPAVIRQAPYPCRAVADVATDVLELPAELIRRLTRHHAAFACEALKLVCEACCSAHGLCSAAQERAEDRVRMHLAACARSFGPTIPLSRLQLAELAGVTRETANRVLLRLQRQGLVRLEFSRVIVRDPARLQEMLPE